MKEILNLIASLLKLAVIILIVGFFIAVIIIAPDGTETHYKSIAECARQTGLTDGVIKNYVNLGTPRKIKDNHHGWRFEEDDEI